jgi:hypothetical protein
MPGMNGYEFVRKTMSSFEIDYKELHNILPDIKIDGFLQKPFSIHQLNDIIYKISIRA